MNRRDKEVDDLLAEIDAISAEIDARKLAQGRWDDVMRDMRESLQRIETQIRANIEAIVALTDRTGGRSDPDGDAS